MSSKGAAATIHAENLGSGSGVHVTALADQPAMHASNAGSGDGLRADSVAGRGAVLGSKVAQLRLIPDAGATHPTSATGDLTVDKKGRLWFCNGGGTHAKWTQLA